MKESKAFLLLAVVSAVLIIGVAYAAITNVNFTITGNATAAPAQENFKVAYGKINEADAPTYVATDKGGADIKKSGETGRVEVAFTTPTDTSATMIVTGLTKAGDKAVATFTVANKSTDLRAQLVDPTGREVLEAYNEEYFDIEVSDFVDTIIAPTGKTTFTVTVTLKKVPVADPVTATIDVAFEAAALETVQPE